MMKEPVVVNGITRWVNAGDPGREEQDATEYAVPVLREEIGEVLRDIRQRQGRTLREVSHDARVSLGYLSEVERGQKEASSELLAAICEALDVPFSAMLREVADRIAVAEVGHVPDTVPEEMTHRFQRGVAQPNQSATGPRGYMAGTH
ncbi:MULTISPECIES: helix-turn-helix domain-containing protein [Auritidibacter]|uniref:helix-turn-helix domain-containing protein n=1 Tax=Auritidibacter TaxID=1160973 RepID=UPI000D730B11|nr:MULTISPECIES: helix-turn-helix transcriptional regulator [Auritidibacter]PXA76082.1 XRE family transcriptional regulator [Auritidibacter sp. NML100628]WGH84703.1 helix-turn-helix transcriptional regulator [Auritidibacter ignavus]WGH91641.1 helix-turn-helix transcriptional regulator [Auritidibacter ignavus]